MKLFLAIISFVVFSSEAFVINPFEIVSKPFGSIFNWNPFDIQNISLVQSFEVENIENGTVVKRDYSYGCKCEDYKCTCCAHVEVHKIKVNDTGCLNMTYSNMNNIDLTFDLSGKVLYNKTISLVNPPDLCFQTGVPLAELCLKFYQLDARNKTFSGSVDLLAKFDGIQIARIKLGSFRFGNRTFYHEQNMVSVHLDRNSSIYSYGNLSDQMEKFNMASKTLISETFENFFNNFEKLSMPQFSMNFQPENAFKNFFNSMFGMRNVQKSNSSILKA